MAFVVLSFAQNYIHNGSITIVQITPLELATLLENTVSKVLTVFQENSKDQIVKSKPYRLNEASNFISVAETTLYLPG